MTKTFKLYWIREDRQGDCEMGEFTTRAEAEAAIPAAKQELLDQCGEVVQRDEVEAGSWSITEGDE